MSFEVNHGSARWASPSQIMLSLEIRGDGETQWRRSTISRGDPSPDFAALFAQATGDDAPFGAIADYVEPEPADVSSAPPTGILPPIETPAPVVLPLPPINWDAEAARFIAAIYTVDGVSVRASMNVWAASVALTAEADRNDADKVCADMVPKLNAWEGAVFAERDRCKALDGATLSDAQWPVLPVGAPQFIAWCAEP